MVGVVQLQHLKSVKIANNANLALMLPCFVEKPTCISLFSEATKN